MLSQYIREGSPSKHINRLDLNEAIVTFEAKFSQEIIACGQHCLQVSIISEKAESFYMASYDPENVAQWLEYLSKGKAFSEWFVKVKSTLEHEQYKLTSHQIEKLIEIVDFCKAFTFAESLTI